MLEKRTANIAFAIGILLSSIYFGQIALDFKAVGLLATSGLSSSFFPITILSFIALCALIVLVQYIYSKSEQDSEKNLVFSSRVAALRGAFTFVAAILGYLVWQYAGFIPMVLTIGPICAFIMGMRSTFGLLFLVVAGFLIYLIFSFLIGVQLN